ncbi:DUF6164 family protein [Nitrosomonas sp. Nm166]|uniref:DUF6164 family protein n=1 Tax=Nitrosomonas sp. Nm166 TaxID=1881054 RepID=UPI0008EFF464|nr:DUF6164 family protein [Nitrosomonas sp. Nm166]SFE90610.1 hypothetical protein SAMN05428977_103532 [Nitrosomonas sp. Nm166]
MSKILFRLNGVSDEEAHDVRQLLADHEIDFYETSPGNWGVSMPAIWLKDEHQFQKARALLDAYQNERVIRVREEYVRLKQEGKNTTFLGTIKQNPVSFIVHLVLTILVLYLSARLILDLAR